MESTATWLAQKMETNRDNQKFSHGAVIMAKGTRKVIRH